MHYMGVDPGVSGGIAVLTETGSLFMVTKMPATDGVLLDALRQIGIYETRCIIERLGGMPRDEKGRAKQSATTMFKMGANYGKLQMALLAAGIPFDDVLPRTWQGEFGLLRKTKTTQTQKKNAHKAKAEHLFPGTKITHAIADALLIAEYCRRVEQMRCAG